MNVTKADGTVVNGVKGPDGKLYEKGQDGKPDTSKPITLAEGDKVNNEGSKFVSGNAVATAIQESGWNIGKADAKDVTKAFEKEAKVHDKVNPNDDVKIRRWSKYCSKKWSLWMQKMRMVRKKRRLLLRWM